ncbi:Acetoin dehydrogenase E1 component alpha-subunit [Paramagnetospirillum magnetotacticum MS-1]|uniref:Acetoin dehydrogenase E1 component alpha-subunit n=1 Tax=Paramagnetospirillum magnetotacticum MS-1 TaxID=272627 RepID=A0A0C2UY66_PARME|nr:thiamine pyrophosphate-dependent enzyme [Paramagnetospirillum magnetotacticum]KIL97751.1 Acetoin dehydrogenase E1 component alpha-subunit [Paramagnetospirillum magnetotacticum MS-1]
MTDGRDNTAEALARQVLRVRLAQMLINEALKAKKFRVPVHLALGHEAIAVAVGAAMAEGDSLFLTHRNIHYNIARATSLAAEVSELALRPDGLAGGRLGSMNMSNPGRGLIYTSSILGNDLCVAAGAAMAETVLGSGAVPFVVTGDGALEEGVFFESLELARSGDAPLVVVVENNGWSLATRIEERRCPIHVDRVAAAFDLPYGRLSGNDVATYAAELIRLRGEALARRRPVVVEVDLATLGDWLMPHPDFPAGKYINYHHGAAPEVTPSDWPVIRDNAEDPVFVLTQRHDADWLRGQSAALLTSLREELA